MKIHSQYFVKPVSQPLSLPIEPLFLQKLFLVSDLNVGLTQSRYFQGKPIALLTKLLFNKRLVHSAFISNLFFSHI